MTDQKGNTQKQQKQQKQSEYIVYDKNEMIMIAPRQTQKTGNI